MIIFLSEGKQITTNHIHGLSYTGSGTSLVAQWLRNPPANAGDTGSIPGPGRCHMPRSN